MKPQPIIKEIKSKILIGMSAEMSFVDDKTGQLFRTFQPRRGEIINKKSENTFDLRVYPQDYFRVFNPSKVFTKWALVEINDIGTIPKEMKIFELQGGKYAVFPYKGLSTDNRIFQYIFTEWLPNAEYELDDRPHFELMTEKTKLNDPNSEEEIWIPIK